MAARMLPIAVEFQAALPVVEQHNTMNTTTKVPENSAANAGCPGELPAATAGGRGAFFWIIEGGARSSLEPVLL
jgi:hypothetical protein